MVTPATPDCLIISDIPTPWREPVFERVHEALVGRVEVVYFSDNERRRLWRFERGRHPKTVLKSISLTPRGTERFFNPGVVPLLLKRRPRTALVVASIKDPSAWLALLVCRLLRTRIAIIADTWMGRDRGIGTLQRLARHIVYNYFADAYVGASKQTLAMFKHYNPRITDGQCFLSHLVADNEHFCRRLAEAPQDRTFDVMFAGRIVPGKNPIFFAQVCAGIRERLGRCRALIIGDGDEALKAQMRGVLDAGGVESDFAGFIPHDALPDYYARARLLLMPTDADCWGVVINEAMLAGTPVITTQWTAAAGELVLHGENGCVLPLEKDRWVAEACALLENRSRWSTVSARAHEAVSQFNYQRAAAGVVSALKYLQRSEPLAQSTGELASDRSGR